MSFNLSLGKSIAFSSLTSIDKLVSMPDSRFKPYAKKVQKIYYQAEARFERSKPENDDHHLILFNFEIAHARWSKMKKAAALRLQK